MHTRNGKKKIIFRENLQDGKKTYNPQRPDSRLCVVEDESGRWRKEWIREDNIMKDKEAGGIVLL